MRWGNPYLYPKGVKPNSKLKLRISEIKPLLHKSDILQILKDDTLKAWD